MSNSKKYAMLLDVYWCTGCHSCEMACKVEHDFKGDHTGVKMLHVGPYEIDDAKWQDDNVVLFTDQCDLCAERRAEGKKPACVQHCQGQCLTFGTVEECVSKMQQPEVIKPLLRIL